MNNGFVIFNDSKLKYLSRGDSQGIQYDLVDNPLWGHIYRSREIAEKQVRALSKSPKTKLSVVELNCTVVSKTDVALKAKPSGYGIRVTMTVSNSPSVYFGEDGKSGMIKDRYQMLGRVTNPNDCYYQDVFSVIRGSSDSAPSSWKTLAGATRIKEMLVAHISEDRFGRKFIYEIVNV